MLFDTIFYEWDEIPLKHPINVDVQLIGHAHIIDYKPLDILVKGISDLDCEIKFQDELDMLYDEIGLEIDDDLTLTAQKIKQRILWHVNGK